MGGYVWFMLNELCRTVKDACDSASPSRCGSQPEVQVSYYLTVTRSSNVTTHATSYTAWSFSQTGTSVASPGQVLTPVPFFKSRKSPICATSIARIFGLHLMPKVASFLWASGSQNLCRCINSMKTSRDDP